MPRWTVLLLALAAALLPSPVLPLQVEVAEVEAKREPELTEQAARQPDSNQLPRGIDHGRQFTSFQEQVVSWANWGARILIGENSIRPGSLDFFLVVLGALAICLFAGLMSGLTLGLLSVEDTDLEIIMRSGKHEEVDQARKVKSLVKDTHQLLVTLLLCNAAAMEGLPILLDMIMSPGLAILLSVTGVLFFGEILPQAVCKTMGLKVGAMAAPLVWALMALCYPVARPIALLLDYLLGSEHNRIYPRPQFKAVLEIHKEQGELMDKEATVMGGALDLALKTCGCCMQSVGQVKSLAIDAVLDDKTMDWIIETGYSRIPICEKGDPRKLKGVLLTKRLIKVRAEDAVAVKDLTLNPIHHISEDMPLYDLLDTFRSGKSHMAAVYSRELEDESGKLVFPAEGCAAIGIVTLEDVIEELINEEILDEMDDSESSPRTGRRHGSGMLVSLMRSGATPKKSRSRSASALA